jgi:hypothetical protein
MREKTIEEYLRDKIKAVGGKAYKWVSPGNNGVPDRIVVLPGGKVVFVELKATGKTSTALQKAKQEELIKMGCTVYRDIDSKEKVDLLIRGIL